MSQIVLKDRIIILHTANILYVQTYRTVKVQKYFLEAK